MAGLGLLADGLDGVGDARGDRIGSGLPQPDRPQQGHQVLIGRGTRV
ncbi:hypothetical protein [Paractinoplanes maris]|nr:hypothetical protein [Actinoplanes maris]